MGRARVAELVDALDLGSSIARCGGSSPFARTNSEHSLSGGQTSTECARVGLTQILRIGIFAVTMKTVETENKGLKRAYKLTIPAKDIDARVTAKSSALRRPFGCPAFGLAKFRRI